MLIIWLLSEVGIHCGDHRVAARQRPGHLLSSLCCSSCIGSTVNVHWYVACTSSLVGFAPCAAQSATCTRSTEHGCCDKDVAVVSACRAACFLFGFCFFSVFTVWAFSLGFINNRVEALVVFLLSSFHWRTVRHAYRVAIITWVHYYLSRSSWSVSFVMIPLARRASHLSSCLYHSVSLLFMWELLSCLFSHASISAQCVMLTQWSLSLGSLLPGWELLTCLFSHDFIGAQCAMLTQWSFSLGFIFTWVGALVVFH